MWAGFIVALNEFGPGIAGAIVSLAFIKGLSNQQRAYWGICGALVALYVGPAITEHFFKSASPSTDHAIRFMTGVVGMTALPFVIRKITDKLSGNQEAKP